jgi:hypothetical protein
MRLFHATRTQNIDSIQSQGLLARWDGVYLTDSIESAQRWMGWRFAAQGDRTFAVVEICAEGLELEEGADHSPLMHELFGAGKSLVCAESVPPDRIREIHLFSIGA